MPCYPAALTPRLRPCGCGCGIRCCADNEGAGEIVDLSGMLGGDSDDEEDGDEADAAEGGGEGGVGFGAEAEESSVERRRRDEKRRRGLREVTWPFFLAEMFPVMRQNALKRAASGLGTSTDALLDIHVSPSPPKHRTRLIQPRRATFSRSAKGLLCCFSREGRCLSARWSVSARLSAAHARVSGHPQLPPWERRGGQLRGWVPLAGRLPGA